MASLTAHCKDGTHTVIGFVEIYRSVTQDRFLFKIVPPDGEYRINNIKIAKIIYGFASKVVPLCLIYNIKSLELTFMSLAQFLLELAHLSMLFISQLRHAESLKTYATHHLVVWK